MSGSILDVVAKETGDEGAVNAGTVKELREPPGRVLSELGLGVVHRVLGLALAIARLPFKTVCEELETVPRARRSGTRGGSGQVTHLSRVVGVVKVWNGRESVLRSVVPSF